MTLESSTQTKVIHYISKHSIKTIHYHNILGRPMMCHYIPKMGLTKWTHRPFHLGICLGCLRQNTAPTSQVSARFSIPINFTKLLTQKLENYIWRFITANPTKTTTLSPKNHHNITLLSRISKRCHAHRPKRVIRNTRESSIEDIYQHDIFYKLLCTKPGSDNKTLLHRH